MPPRFVHSKPAAFTLVELLVVVVIVVILVAMLLPARSGRNPTRFSCISRQKQNLLGFMLFASDHNEKYPWLESTNGGGVMEQADSGDAVACYQVLSGYLKNPAQFVCPTDPSRSPALATSSLRKTNLSYFASIEPLTTNSPTYQIMTGDRHLESNGKAASPGLFLLSPNQSVSWTAELHDVKKKASGGAIGFADGHVEWVKTTNFNSVVLRQNIPTNRLAVP